MRMQVDEGVGRFREFWRTAQKIAGRSGLLQGAGEFHFVYEEGCGRGGFGYRRFERSSTGWDGHRRLPNAGDLHWCTDAGNASETCHFVPQFGSRFGDQRVYQAAPHVSWE